MVYIHGEEIDRPLGSIRNGKLWTLHYDYRGLPYLGTDTTSAAATCTTIPQVSCLDFRWPGRYWTPFNQMESDTATAWAGSLPASGRDGTGQLYRRNRYYDPGSGQFTQADPIGIAGGINLYGFANGDPINYSDPFGLCAKESNGGEDANCLALIRALRQLSRLRDISPEVRAAFVSAADVLEHDVTVPVRFRLAEYRPFNQTWSFGSWIGPRSFNSGLEVALNQGSIDIGLTAWHEVQHSLGRGHDEINPAQRALMNSLPAKRRREAVITNWTTGSPGAPAGWPWP